jgi:hypothetical protein
MEARMTGKALLAVLALAALAAPVARASAPAGSTYALSFELRRNGVLIGHPRLLVGEDSRSAVSTDGPDAYRIETTLSRQDDREALAFRIYRMRDGAQTLVAAPRMIIVAGTTGNIAMGGEDGFSLKISAAPVGGGSSGENSAA